MKNSTNNKLFYIGLAYLLIFAALGIANNASGQNAEGFKLAETSHSLTSKETAYTLNIDGVQFSAFLTAKGQNYIWRTSKKGNKYKMYLGYDYGQTFDGSPIYTNKEGTEFWILKVGYNQYPLRMYLEKE